MVRYTRSRWQKIRSSEYCLLITFSSVALCIKYRSNLQCTVLMFFQNGFQEHTRDPERTPMQWNTKNYAGFTDGNGPWLPVNADYKTKNVKVIMKSVVRKYPIVICFCWFCPKRIPFKFNVFNSG